MIRKSTHFKFGSRKISSRKLLFLCAWGLLSSGAYEGMAQSYSLKGWGSQLHGRIGNGENNYDLVYAPVDVYTDTGFGGKFVQVSAGHEFSVGIKENGSLWAWGSNSNGQLGRPGITSAAVPVIVDSGLDGKWKKVSAGYAHCIALKEDSSTWVWGRNAEGQLGTGDYASLNVPTAIAPTSKVIDVCAWGMSEWAEFWEISRSGSAAILADSTLYMWGSNNNLTLGVSGAGSNQPQSVRINGERVKALQISIGIQGHVLVIRADSTLWSWGLNSYGQLGNGGESQGDLPAQVSPDKWLRVAAGHVHSLAIRADGSLWGWGQGVGYKLGNGLSDLHKTPALADDGSNGKWVEVYAGRNSGIGVLEDGTVWSWGSNDFGVSGTGNTASYIRYRTQLPYRFVTLEGMSIDINNQHVLASGMWYYECEKPAPRIESLGKTAELVWDRVPGAAVYEIAIDRSATAEPSATPVQLTDTFYSSGNMLTALDTFYVHYRSSCGYGNYSDWDTISFIAPFQCRSPRGIAVTAIGPDSVSLSWESTDSLQYFEVVIDQTPDLLPSGATVQVTDTLHNSGKTLNPDEVYYVHIRTFCTNNEYSDWDTLSFRTLPFCNAPAGLAATAIGEDNAELNWEANPLAVEYQIAVDQSSTKEPGSAPVTVTVNEYATGNVLSENELYYVHIRTHCGGGNYSDWDTLSFRTAEQLAISGGIAEAPVRIYPNPVRDVLYVSGVSAYEASVLGMDGKLLFRVQNMKEGINVSALVPGVYILVLKDAEGNNTAPVRFTKAAH